MEGLEQPDPKKAWKDAEHAKRIKQHEERFKTNPNAVDWLKKMEGKDANGQNEEQVH